MKRARVPLRIGHLNRLYYFWLANKIIYIKRKRCDLHQAQMCMQYLKALGFPFFVPVNEIPALIRLKPSLHLHVKQHLDSQVFNLVIHPGSNGHTIEWPKAHFAKLIEIMPKNVKIFVTGSAKEAEQYGDLIHCRDNVTPLFGAFSVSELTSFLKYADGVVVGSTGPLHIAAALGTKVLGLFPAQKDLDVKRWGPIGVNASTLESPHCMVSTGRTPKRCDCMKYITPEEVLTFIQKNWLTNPKTKC